jgi:hypothetical protein
MRYAKSKSRLVLAVSSGEVERLVACAARLVIPRYSRKMYFLGDGARVYSVLERLAERLNGFTIVREGAEPSNLTSIFRIVHHGEELIVVPGVNNRFPPAEWDRVILELESAASSGDLGD